MESLIGILTILASFSVKLLGFPRQILKIRKAKSIGSISKGLFTLSFISFTLWTIYGLLKGDWVIVIGQGIGVIVSGIIVFQIYKYSVLKSENSKKISKTKNKNQKEEGMSSTYSYNSDERRLKIQADRLYDFDMTVIEKVVHGIRENKNKKTIKILDIGCADGYLTVSRFSKFDNVEVVGIDKSKDAISNANSSFSNISNFTFKVADVENGDYVFKDYDIVFSALVFHHFKNPEKVLKKAWSYLNNGGCLMIRGTDDGLKLTYPVNPDIEFLLNATEIKGSSDRKYGRKIYSQFMNLSPKPLKVEMEFKVDSTVSKNESEKLNFFEHNYSYRANYAKKLLEHENVTMKDVDFVNELKQTIKRQREYFINSHDLFSIAIHNIAIAFKKIE